MPIEVKFNKNMLDWPYEKVESELYDIAIKFTDLLKTEIKSEWFDTGETYEDIFTRKKDGAIEVGGKMTQFWIAETGRKPGKKMPPLDAMASWTARKHIHDEGEIPYDQLSSKAKGKVYVIARSIGRKGIPAKHLLTKIYKLHIERLRQLFLSHFRK